MIDHDIDYDPSTDVGPSKHAEPQGRSWPVRWMRRLLGWDCWCGGEWGAWEVKERKEYRLPNQDEIDRAHQCDIEIKYLVSKITSYQERRCQACGKIQQEELGY
jgi:hypothetical protein